MRKAIGIGCKVAIGAIACWIVLATFYVAIQVLALWIQAHPYGVIW